MSLSLTQISDVLSADPGLTVTIQDDCICITNEEGLDAFLAISGEQIAVQSVLFSKESVNDAAGLNEDILKTAQLFPLTSVIIAMIDGQEYYAAFGALSAQSNEESVVIEVNTLFDNVSGLLEAYSGYLK